MSIYSQETPPAQHVDARPSTDMIELLKALKRINMRRAMAGQPPLNVNGNEVLAPDAPLGNRGWRHTPARAGALIT